MARFVSARPVSGIEPPGPHDSHLHKGLIGFLPRLLVAILILFVGAFLVVHAGKAAQATSASMGVEFRRRLGKAACALVLITAFIIADLALAFGLGGRDIARNVLAGNYARDVYRWATGW